MCDIDVNLPTVVSFLMLYSLRCGCIIICIWTMCRACCFVIFFTMAMLETFVAHTPPLGAIFSPKPKPAASSDVTYFVFLTFLIVIITECFLILYCIYFALGLYHDSPGRVKQYLVCRFCTWLIETSFITLLSIAHHDLIGWFLVFLMIIIIEFYGFIVAYSYYRDMAEEMSKRAEEIEEEDDADQQGGGCAVLKTCQ